MNARALVLALVVALAVLVGCKRAAPTPTPSWTALQTTAPLRDAFDRDVGSVRVIMLVSPT
jgi:hypothetical protein